MKITLLGEFSGFHNNLKSGLQLLGHQVQLVAGGDGYKKLAVDVSLDSRFSGVFGKAERVIRGFLAVCNLHGQDLVQLVNPVIFPQGIGLNQRLIRQLMKQNGKIALSACGDDNFFVSQGIHQMRYNPISEALHYDYRREQHPYDNPTDRAWNLELAQQVDHIIPVMHEYELAYRDFSNTGPCIPLPVDCGLINFEPLKATKKIVVFHGLNRYGFKGTRYVEQAFEILSRRYPTQLELVIKGGMPLKDYLALMRQTHVVIDQVNSYSCGMNALYALAMGKVVIGGAEPESLKALGIDKSPVINVIPEVASIVSAVERVLHQKNDIEELSLLSRQFVEQVHSHSKVAELYLRRWNT
ncbi:glycosyltransferase [Rheinheimera marina]|uniref:Glycosyltransferase n=1 Tax=Rheinheimera marina TaxID=1774958 RepID=A0ABV9JRI4_9GAMM